MSYNILVTIPVYFLSEEEPSKEEVMDYLANNIKSLITDADIARIDEE